MLYPAIQLRKMPGGANQLQLLTGLQDAHDEAEPGSRLAGVVDDVLILYHA